MRVRWCGRGCFSGRLRFARGLVGCCLGTSMYSILFFFSLSLSLLSIRSTPRRAVIGALGDMSANAFSSTGVISSTLISINTDLSGRSLTTLDKSLITSATSFFALLASPLTGLVADALGRKPVILAADLLFVLGAVWQAYTTSVWGMILGRSVVGAAVGSASFVVPLYISELSPSPFRGRLVTVCSLFITGGRSLRMSLGGPFRKKYKGGGGWLDWVVCQRWRSLGCFS